MPIADYFTKDDGSLPEIEVIFPTSETVEAGLQLLLSKGGHDIAVGGTLVWPAGDGTGHPFRGAEDARSVADGAVLGFHLLLAGIQEAGVVIPDLGVLVSPNALCLDYRMGRQWGDEEVAALLAILRQFSSIGGYISVAGWWGLEADTLFATEIAHGGAN